MPQYVVKITQKNGWLRVPVVANFPDEHSAISAVRQMIDEGETVEVRGIRPDVMKAAFGDIPEGAAIFRPDWTWRGENSDTPEPAYERSA